LEPRRHEAYKPDEEAQAGAAQYEDVQREAARVNECIARGEPDAVSQ
jgi:phage protein D